MDSEVSSSEHLSGYLRRGFLHGCMRRAHPVMVVFCQGDVDSEVFSSDSYPSASPSQLAGKTSAVCVKKNFNSGVLLQRSMSRVEQ